MGEAAEAVLDGSVCQVCGEWFDDIIEGEEPPGYPRTCATCERPGETIAEEDEP
jgi:hypothetical protein